MQVDMVNRLMESEKVQSLQLTPQAQQLYNALADVKNWVNRTELAKLTGKSVLNKWDLVLLNKLTDAGLIEIQQIPRHGLINYEWQYLALKRNPDGEMP
jgi:hypothetical protein